MLHISKLLNVSKFSVTLFVTFLINGYVCSPVHKAGYEYVPDANTWLRLHEVPMTWPDAFLQCHLEGGQLASPESLEMTSAMKSMLAVGGLALGRVFTGIHAIIAKGHYTAIDGTPLANISLAWAAGEPDNLDNSEDCLVMTGAGELADVKCTNTYPYFCQKSNKKMNVNTCGTTAEGYKRNQDTGSCYKFHLTPQSWHRAAATCAAEGAHLAVINSDEESKALSQIINTYRKPNNQLYTFMHIGFWDWNMRAEFTTIFGETLDEAGFSKWQKNQPDNYAGVEYCGSMMFNGLLNDIDCNGKIGFICEITP